MPVVKWNDVPDPDDFPKHPAGDYPVRVVKIDEDIYANPIVWTMTLEITEGPLLGQRFQDKMWFSEKALKRVKLVCSRFKLDTEGEVTLLPEHLLGREAWCHLEVETWEGKERNKVPFAGYSELQEWKQPENEQRPVPQQHLGQQNLGAAPPPPQGQGSGAGQPNDDVPF